MAKRSDKVDEAVGAGERVAADAAPQHLMALRRANEVRLARKELKRKISSQEVPAAQVVLECPWEADSMEISDILMSQRRWGRARCRRLLLSLGMPENKQLGTLTERQRFELAVVLSHKIADEDEVAEGETSPPVTSRRSELLAALRTVASERDQLTERLDTLASQRDRLIREASALGVSRREVAAAAGLTVGRIQQLVDQQQHR